MLADILTRAVVGVFAAWFVLSVINQFGWKWFEAVRSQDAFSLLPFWSFFAPNPGMSDYHLLYRDRLVSSGTGVWRELRLDKKLSLWRVLWSPDKRKAKALQDAAGSLLEMRRESIENLGIAGEELRPLLIRVSIAYLVLLHLVNNASHSPMAESTQFMIAETHGHFTETKPEPVFVSDFHPLC